MVVKRVMVVVVVVIIIVLRVRVPPTGSSKTTRGGQVQAQALVSSSPVLELEAFNKDPTGPFLCVCVCLCVGTSLSSNCISAFACTLTAFLIVG